MQIVLASSSPYRKRQLEAFGVRFTTERPRVDEERLKLGGPRDPIELTRFLASRKARSLGEAYPDAYVLGSDQMAEIDGRRLDKPLTAEKAREQLTSLAGREHRLITSLAVWTRDREVVETEITHVTLRPLSAEEIAAYVEVDRPLDCAGSYKIECAGLALVEEVRGRDPGAIQGLPLLALRTCFARLDVSLTDLWRTST